MLLHMASVSIRQKLIALGKFEISANWLKNNSKYVVNPHVFVRKKHAGLQRTLNHLSAKFPKFQIFLKQSIFVVQKRLVYEKASIFDEECDEIKIK